MFNIDLYIKIPTTKIAATNNQSSNLIEPQPHLIHRRSPPPHREANHIPRVSNCQTASQNPKNAPKSHHFPRNSSYQPTITHPNTKKASSGLLKRPDTQKLTTTKTSHYPPSLFIYIYVCLIKDIVTT